MIKKNRPCQSFMVYGKGMTHYTAGCHLKCTGMVILVCMLKLKHVFSTIMLRECIMNRYMSRVDVQCNHVKK